MSREDGTIIEAERACLAAIMRRAPTFDRVSDVLTPDDFGRAEHREVFAAMCALASDTTDPSFDPRRLAMAMGAGPARADISDRLDALAADAPAGSLDGAIAAVRAASILRQLDAAAHEIRRISDEAGYGAAMEAVGQAEAVLAGISTSDRAAVDITLRTALRLMVDEVKARADGHVRSPLVPTGLASVNTALGGGLRPGFMHILGARPKMGKTAMAVQIAAAVALSGRGVVYQTTEVPRSDIAQRVAASVGRLRAASLDVDMPTWSEISALVNAVGRLNDASRWVLIPDEPAATPQDVARNVRKYTRLKGAPPLGLVVVDQINDLRHPDPKRVQSRERELAEIGNTLKDLFRSARAPGLVLSQLSRKCEDRPNKRPVPSDLRDSGSLEQQAGVVAFLYRDEVYAATDENKGKAELSVAMNRKGPTGLAHLRWDGECQRFDDPAPDWVGGGRG